MPADSLADFQTTRATFDGVRKNVYRAGEGPGIVVMTEIPGITPEVANFARRLVADGYTVAMPDLFGEAGKEASNGYLLNSIARACVSSEFATMALGKTSPVTSWLRQLCNQLHQQCGGPGVGAIGMCLTGGFALALMVEDSVVAPVLSQPSLPFAFGKERCRDLGINNDDLRVVKERVAGGCEVLGLRFTGDRMVGDRFARLTEELGDGFLAVEIDSSKGNAHGISGAAHSVLTDDLVETEGHPTLDGLRKVMSFFDERLRP